jgi:hypothetical protein
MKFYLGVGLIAFGLLLSYVDDTTTSLDALDASLPNGLNVPVVVLIAGAGILGWAAWKGEE